MKEMQVGLLKPNQFRAASKKIVLGCLSLELFLLGGGLQGCSGSGYQSGVQSASSTDLATVGTTGANEHGISARQLVKPALEVATSPDISPLTLNTVLVYPFETSVGELHAINKETLEQGTTKLLAKLQVATSLQLLNSDSSKDRDVTSAITKTRGQALPLRERALRSGKLVDAQGVLFGLVSRFEDAEGSRLGESGKSSVSFQLFLADVRSGKIVWQANFNESNQPLSENIFRFGNVARQGFQYKSAEQIFDEGLGSAAADLESARKRRS